MILGKIDYLNLLPFYVFLKKHNFNIIIKNGYPSQINSLFYQKKVNGAFISSIKSKNKKCLDAGIVANKKVLSVLVCDGEMQEDIESETSNALAKLLHQHGKILIGDKALKIFFHSNNCKDLAHLWYKKYKLPFVFARFCINDFEEEYKYIINKFLNTKIYIPYYILNRYAKRLNLSYKEIRYYLTLIDYKLSWKEKKSLRLFLKKIS